MLGNDNVGVSSNNFLFQILYIPSNEMLQVFTKDIRLKPDRKTGAQLYHENVWKSLVS